MEHRRPPLHPLGLSLLVGALLAGAAWAGVPVRRTVLHAQIHGQAERRPAATATPMARLPAEVTATIPLQCPRAVVAFRNAGATPLTLHMADAPPRPIAARQTLELCAEDDTVSWQVTAASGWRYGGRMDVAGLVRREETLVEPGATLQVTNATGEKQRLALGGRDIGSLEAGQTLTLGPIIPGLHTLLARGMISQRREARRVRVAAGETTALTWQQPPTWTRVHNKEAEAAHITIDGVAYGDVAPGAEVRILGLVPGKHQVLLAFVPSGRVKRLEVRASAVGDPPGKSAEIDVDVHNGSRELLDIPKGLAAFGTVLDVGATLHMRVPRRTWGATLVGRDSGLRYHHDFHAQRDPEVLTWRVKRPEGTLRVRNATGLDLGVSLPGGVKVRVPAGKTAVARVPAGRLTLVAEAEAAGKRQWRRGVTLAAGKELTWRVKAEPAALIVASSFAEPLLLRLDTAAQVKLLPGKSIRLQAPPGRHTLAARAPRSGTAAALELEVREGERQTVQLRPPTGSLRLKAGALPLTVHVRGVEVAEVQPGETAAVPVTAGQVQAEVRDAEHPSANFLGLVAPTQQVELALPTADRAAVEIAWQGKSTAEVTLDAGAARLVQPGASLRLEGVRRGAHLVAIAAGGVSWRRWLQIDGQQPVARFVLRPTP